MPMGARQASAVERERLLQPPGRRQISQCRQRRRAENLNAVERRWFNKCYQSEDDEDTDYFFDMKMAITPDIADLAYLGAMIATAARADELRKKITDEVVNLFVALAEHAAAGDIVSGAEIPAKRNNNIAGGSFGGKRDSIASTLHRHARCNANDEDLDELASLGLVTQEHNNLEHYEPSLEEQTHAEHKKVREIQPSDRMGNLGGAGVLSWWANWQHAFPLLAMVARVALGGPASSAVLERDFSDAGRMMTSSRSSTDVGFVEMILFLHGSQEIIPLDMSVLPSDKMTENIPGRLRDFSSALAELSRPTQPMESHARRLI